LGGVRRSVKFWPIAHGCRNIERSQAVSIPGPEHTAAGTLGGVRRSVKPCPRAHCWKNTGRSQANSEVLTHSTRLQEQWVESNVSEVLA
jgi:hypothetical protein